MRLPGGPQPRVCARRTLGTVRLAMASLTLLLIVGGCSSHDDASESATTPELQATPSHSTTAPQANPPRFADVEAPLTFVESPMGFYWHDPDGAVYVESWDCERYLAVNDAIRDQIDLFAEAPGRGDPRPVECRPIADDPDAIPEWPDCTGSTLEMGACSGRHVEELDLDVHQAFAVARRTVDESDFRPPENREMLTAAMDDAQRLWWEERAARCEVAYLFVSPGSAAGLAASECRAAADEERLALLEHWPDTMSPD